MPHELLNNVAVLLIENGKMSEAKTYLQEALENCIKLLEIRKEDQRVQALKLTVKFNLGFLLEE